MVQGYELMSFDEYAVANSKRLFLSSPECNDDDRKALLEAFDSGWLAPGGPQVYAFEKEFAERIGVEHAFAVSSGTAALHLSLLVSGVQPGDVVLTSDLTFVASANVIRYVGATPVFIDSEPRTWNLDPALLADEIDERVRRNQKPKAVLVVDVLGQCPEYAAIQAICKEHEIVLLEDAAEAIGATYRGTSAGAFGDVGCFSFNGNKIVTTSGGGMLVTNRKDWAEKARFLATQAREPELYYEHKEIGFNYRLSGLLGAIGRSQLQRLDQLVEKRRAIFEFYRSHLAELPGVSFMPESPGSFCNRWLSCLTVDAAEFGASRDDVIQALDARNIESRPIWKPMHMQPLYQECQVRGGAFSEQLFRDGLCLPSGSRLTPDDLSRVIETIREIAASRNRDKTSPKKTSKSC